MALIKCRECGQLISDRAVVCPKCGAPQTTPRWQPQEADPTPTIYVQEEKKSNAWLFIVVALLVAVIGGLAYWIFNESQMGDGTDGKEAADTAMVKVSYFADKDYVYDGQWDPEGTHQPCRVKFTKSEGVLSNCSYTNLRYNATIALRGEIDGDSLRFLGKIEGKDLVIVLAPQPGKEGLLCGYGIDYKHEAKKKDMRLYLSDGKALPPSEFDVQKDRYNPDRYVPDEEPAEYVEDRYVPNNYDDDEEEYAEAEAEEDRYEPNQGGEDLSWLNGNWKYGMVAFGNYTEMRVGIHDDFISVWMDGKHDYTGTYKINGDELRYGNGIYLLLDRSSHRLMVGPGKYMERF